MKKSVHRKSIRLKEYDYSQPGGYFVTVCTNKQQCVLGDIIGEKMRLSHIGKIVLRCWEEIPQHFQNVELDEFIIMPNHVHGIIIIDDHSRDVQLNVPTGISPKRGSLSVIVRTFKAAVTTECRRRGIDEFAWQSRFYEHIIRDDRDLSNIRDYISGNILQWASDKENQTLNRI